MSKIKRGAIALLAVFMILLSPVSAFAAAQAGDLKELLGIIRDNGLNRVEEFEVEYTGDKSDVKSLKQQINLIYYLDELALLDDPTTDEDADYLSGNVNIDSVNLSISGNTLSFYIPYFENLNQTAYVKEHIPEVLSELGVDRMSNYDKVKTIHDYVCELITYTDEPVEKNSTAFNALKNGKGLCNSYALLVYRLLVGAGVPAKYIGGEIRSSGENGGHAWNIVALGDKWYYLDATWDDGEDDGIYYDYFLKGSSDFDEADPSAKHTMDQPYRNGSFATYFPIAQTSFVEGMNDVNTKVKIGDGDYEPSDPSDPDDPDDPDPYDPEGEYDIWDIVEDVYPEDGYFTVKKGKTNSIEMLFAEGMEDLIEDIDYEFIYGKKRLKVKDFDLYEDPEYNEVFLAFDYKGKKKGDVGIVFYIYLTNGQTLEMEFEGKVK